MNSSISASQLNLSVDGFIILDKPSGMSSNQALGKLKRLVGQKKAGHAGTLDPMATGMLPVAFGRATKLLEYCLDHDKRYVATIQFGAQTDTGDKEGQVVARCGTVAGGHRGPPLRQSVLPSGEESTSSSGKNNMSSSGWTGGSLEQVLTQFMGEIQQIPPMYSALKHEGRRLYQLARKGEEVERKARIVEIKKLEMLSYDQDKQQLSIDVTCSKGTYIRVLGEDIAKALGTLGHLISLRRVETAGFSEFQMVTLAQVEATLAEQDRSNLLPSPLAGEGLGVRGLLLPMEKVLTTWPRINITHDDWIRLSQGKSIEFTENLSGYVRLFCDDLLIAIAELNAGELIDRKLIRVL